MPLSLVAQVDDMYYVPGKSQKSDIVKAPDESDQPTYYCGSDRDVDEYNRRGRVKSYYQKIGTDTLGNDIIEFHEGDGIYGFAEGDDTDTVYVDDDKVAVYPGSVQYYDDSDYDYTYSRNLGMFDGFYGWYDPYFSMYWGGPYWWRYGSYWYDPWYYGMYYPWYWNGWYSPYYYGWNGWYGWRPSYYYSYSGPTGTTNHSTGKWHSSGRRTTGFSGYRGSGNGTSGSFGNRYNSYNKIITVQPTDTHSVVSAVQPIPTLSHGQFLARKQLLHPLAEVRSAAAVAVDRSVVVHLAEAAVLVAAASEEDDKINK